jgi:hypothetical protein
VRLSAWVRRDRGRLGSGLGRGRTCGIYLPTDLGPRRAGTVELIGTCVNRFLFLPPAGPEPAFDVAAQKSLARLADSCDP